MDQSGDEADSDEAPAPPKPQKQKKPKASKPSNVPRDLHVKPLATAPTAPSVHSAGTEPKIKFYFGAAGDNADDKIAQLKEQFVK